MALQNIKGKRTIFLLDLGGSLYIPITGRQAVCERVETAAQESLQENMTALQYRGKETFLLILS